MGHYREEGSPFYFINQRMLQYLGYLDEKEFVEEIGGCISNCTHPEDRSFVERSIQAQLDSGEEYTVEYRMRKKDGSYIWIHDTGHKTLAEDGRPAITSVCSDITAQRLAQLEVMNIYNNIPGAVLIRKKNNERITITKAVFKIGKERRKVDYCISDNTNISRSHADVVFKDGQFFIIDNNACERLIFVLSEMQ